MSKITDKDIKDLILKEFSNKEFTIGAVYYKIKKEFDRSLFGKIRNIVVNLSREKFLEYRIADRGMPFLNSEKKIKGAIYKLKK